MPDNDDYLDDEIMETLDTAVDYNQTWVDGPYDSMTEQVVKSNATYIVDIRYALPLYGYIMPIFVVITMVANTLIILVLSKKHMRTPTNTVLMAMALCDMLTLVFPAPWFCYLYTFGNYRKPLHHLAACYAYRFMHEIIPQYFHTASIWLTLALAVQRYIYVCHPPLARTWCTMERVNKAVIWIFVLDLLHQLPRCFDQDFESESIRSGNVTTTQCRVVTPYWVKEVITENVYYNIFYWFRVVFVHSLPCFSLVVLNVLLFRALRRAQQKRDKLFKENKKQSECRKLRDSNCTTLMLIVIVTIFLLVEVPLAVVTVLHIMNNCCLTLASLDYQTVNTLIVFTNFFISLSYPLNFAIYCGMSRQFRETFQDLFIPGRSSATLDLHQNDSCHYSIVNGMHPLGGTKNKNVTHMTHTANETGV